MPEIKIIEKYTEYVYPIEQSENQKSGSLYLMKNLKTGFCKIGYTIDLSRREREVSNACGCKINLIDFVELSYIKADEPVDKAEKWLHKYFKEKRLRGEWFNLSKADIKSIQNLFIHIA